MLLNFITLISYFAYFYLTFRSVLLKFKESKKGNLHIPPNQIIINFQLFYWNIPKHFQTAVKMLNSSFIKYAISIKKEKENMLQGSSFTGCPPPPILILKIAFLNQVLFFFFKYGVFLTVNPQILYMFLTGENFGIYSVSRIF